MSKSILSLNGKELKDFLLKQESYTTIDFPPYIDFMGILKQSEDAFKSKKGDYKNLDKLHSRKNDPRLYEGLNYQLLHNKNDILDWRKFELINPVLYVSLALIISNDWDNIKKRLNKLISRSCVDCNSLPMVSETESKDKAEKILNWWEDVEQKSIEQSVEYESLYHTDISNCYGSLYTHSIPWALHSKKIAKLKQRDNKLIGNQIDKHLRQMSFGQTNGIPQGSVLMDLVAEFVLLYMDFCFTVKLKELYGKDVFSKIKILRYRDDYRFFTNDKKLAEEGLKELSHIMIDFGFKLNSSKTLVCEDVILGSIKKDKLHWLKLEKEAGTYQKRLLIFYSFLQENKNCGVSARFLQEFYESIKENKLKVKNESIKVIISIVVNIAYNNPRTYPVCMAILSLLLEYIDDNSKNEIVRKIIKKFQNLPNSSHLEVWLQRASIKYLAINSIKFKEKICKLVNGENDIYLWNFDWLNNDVKDKLLTTKIIRSEILDIINHIIESEEFKLFDQQS